MPVFLVGKPWTKQYISQDSLPYLQAFNTASSHGSSVRKDFVRKKVCCTLSLPLCQNILYVLCSKKSYPFL